MSQDEWDQEDEHRRADFEHMLARMEQDWLERGVDSAEEAVARAPQMTSVPMPNTAHPSLERYATGVRAMHSLPAVRLPKVRRVTALSASADDPIAVEPACISTMLLTKRKAAGPAPFVRRTWDDEAMYFWWVWTDDETGRHVTSDAELVWR